MENTNQEENVQEEKSLEPITGLNAGALVKGKVLAVKDEKVTIDFGAPFKAELKLSAMNEANVIVGASYEFMIEELDLAAEKVVLSKRIADNLRVFNRVQSAFNDKKQVEGLVVAQVKGGYSVDIGMRAFLPQAQAHLRPVADPRDIIDQKLQFVITKFDAQKASIQVSRRPILEAERAEQGKEQLAKLQEGQVIEGVVSNLAKFGAFVDLGGIDGLLHINDMAYTKITDPSAVVKAGDKVTVKILKIDAENQKINVGLKQLQEDPWAAAKDQLVADKVLSGKVVSLTKFGAFIELFPAVQGMVHISEFDWVKRINKPEDVVKVGDEIQVKIIEADLEEHRLALSVKRLSENPWAVFAKEHPVGSKIKGVVRDLADFGAFVDVAEGITGLLHRGDVSWTDRKIVISERFHAGDELAELVILNIDLEKQRLSLGLKQLTEDPWKVFSEAHKVGSIVTAKVTGIEKFGLMMEIEPGFVGLCHVSELAEDRVEDISTIAKEGDELEVAILAIDTRKQKISLSLKAAKNNDGTLEYLAEQNRSLGSLGDVMPADLKAASDK